MTLESLKSLGFSQGWHDPGTSPPPSALLQKKQDCGGQQEKLEKDSFPWECTENDSNPLERSKPLCSGLE